MENMIPNEVKDYVKYSNKELKKKNFFQKSVVVGLTGLAILSALNMGYGAINSSDALLKLSGNQRDQIVQVIEQTNEMGFKELYIPKYSPYGPAKYVRKFNEEIQGKNLAMLKSDFSYTSSISRSFDMQRCSIYLSVPSESIIEHETIKVNDTSRVGDVDFSQKNYISVTKSNGEEWNADNVFSAAFAIGKCDVGSNPALYQVFKEQSLNDLFAKVEKKDYYNSSYNSTFGSRSVTDNAGSILENGYSEAIAIILTSRSDLSKKEEFLEKRMAYTLFARNNVYKDIKAETVARDVYAVHEYSRTPEIQEKIKSVKNAEDIRVLATEMAHHNFQQVVASKNPDAFYTQERLNREAFDSYLNRPLIREGKEANTFWSNVAVEVAQKFSREEAYSLESAVKSVGGVNSRTENTHAGIPDYALRNAFNKVGDINAGSAEYKTLQVALQDLVKDVQVTKAFDIKPEEIKDTEVAINVIKINKEFVAQKKQELADKELPIMTRIAKSLKLG